MRNDFKTQQLNEMLQILRRQDIVLDVGGCGCCGSPWVKFVYKGKIVFDGEHAAFYMSEGTKNDD